MDAEADQSEEHTDANFHKCPGQPSAQEEEEHRCSHIPYRSWCKWCVMGRGLGTPHSGSQSHSQVPRVGLDYFFITDVGVKKKQKLEMTNEEVEKAISDGSIIKCVIVRDWDGKSLWAHVIPRKGVDRDNYSAQMVVKDLRWMGYHRIILKYDNESAIGALANKVAELIRADNQAKVMDIGHENRPTYDSQANGGTEAGVKL